MKRFFVDTENVGKNWIQIAEQNPYSVFYLVFSDHNVGTKMNFATFQNLDTIDFRFKYCETNNEKNALDYTLVKLIRSELLEKGCLSDEIYIISDDKGYDKHERKFGLYQIQITRIPVDIHTNNRETTNSKSKNKKKKKAYKLNDHQKKSLRRLCNDYRYSWAKKEMSDKMREEARTILAEHSCDADELIEYYLLREEATFNALNYKPK